MFILSNSCSNVSGLVRQLSQLIGQDPRSALGEAQIWQSTSEEPRSAGRPLGDTRPNMRTTHPTLDAWINLLTNLPRWMQQPVSSGQSRDTTGRCTILARTFQPLINTKILKLRRESLVRQAARKGRHLGDEGAAPP